MPDLPFSAVGVATPRRSLFVPGVPELPIGRRVVLPGRGTTFVRELGGPPGAPVLLLVHGWIATAGLNWFTSFDTLAGTFRVVAPDLRGHGRGIRSRRRFRLADCADDLAALCEVLRIRRVVAVGYSMGGPVVQLLWRRHPSVVAGLVMCATSDRFVHRSRDRLVFTSMMSVAAGISGAVGMALFRDAAGPGALTDAVAYRRARSIQRWAAEEMRRHDWTAVLQAGRALGTYDASGWVGAIDVPCAVVVTDRDRAVPPALQLGLAARIPGATVHRVDAGHTACAGPALAGPLLDACRDVATRAGLLRGGAGAPAP